MSERRVPYFERPAPPHDWRWKVSLVGRTLIVLGLLMFGFVGYQLWGTGIQTAQAQHTLDRQFADQLAGTSTSTSTTPTSTTAEVPGPTTSTIAATTSTTPTSFTVPVAPVPIPANGAAVARLKIASIGLTYTVVQGVGVADLKKGPGHFPETPMPGQFGNAAIAGHRTTYGHPFFKLDKVKIDDLIEVDTLLGHFVYQVTGSRVVSPSQYAEVIPTLDPTVATLTLATCTPAYTARQRLIVFSKLVAAQSSPVSTATATGAPSTGGLPGDGASPSSAAPSSVAPSTQPVGSTTSTTPSSSTSAPTTTVTGGAVISPPPGNATGAAADAFSSGWFDDGSAIPHVLLWGALLLGVCALAFLIGKRANRLWVCFVVGTVPFLVVLYFFFENVNRLLPSSI